MMNGMEESDSSGVGVKPTSEGRPVPAESVEQRAPGPRGIREAKARAGHRAGEACFKRPTGYGDCRAAKK